MTATPRRALAAVAIAAAAGLAPTACIPEQAAPALSLPRVPWEGGPAYWARFERASDWTDPAFFPIVLWHGGVSSTSEVEWDSRHGINTYLGLWEGTPFDLLADGGMYWIGDALNESFDEDSSHWPGVFLGDEFDGRFSSAEGRELLRRASDLAEGTGRFRYANYTQLVIGGDLDVDIQESYVNDFTDVVSLDMYWYTIPFCDRRPYRGAHYAVPVPAHACRTASSYGRSLAALTLRDAADGVLQPRWQFIENLNGLSGHDHVAEITPAQLKGAAMSSLINEARGILWFNQSFTGGCQTSNAIRSAQLEGSSWCGAAQIQAMGEINRLIADLAPVLNTQSWEWDFGQGLDTMLKTDAEHAYVFAMTDGGTGTRAFTLPEGIDGADAEVIGEGREIPIVRRSFSDTFPGEQDFRIYRIALHAP